MNTCKTEEEYIGIVAPAVCAAVKKAGGYLPSVLIAQSCLENGYGIPSYWDNPQIAALLKYNNMVGIKASLLNASWADKSVWPGKSLTKETPEVYGGKRVTITDNSRIYDSIEQSFEDYLLFMKYASNTKGGAPKYGEKVLSITDPETLIRTVSRLGYATGTTYADSVMRIIRKHNLTQYDHIKSAEEKHMKVYPIIDNRAESRSQVPKWRSTKDIKWIVVHYLGVVGENFNLWNGGYGATYTIAWDGTIHHTTDYTGVTWQCGGKLQGSGGHQYYQKCTNFNSVSVEMCVKRTDGKYSGNDSDDKWYFTTETQEAAVQIVSKMMDDLGIDVNHVIRHYDVTGKICPNPYVRNNHTRTSWTWDEFKARLAEYRKTRGYTVPAAADKPKAEEIFYRVRTSWADEKSQIGAYTVLQNAIAASQKHPGTKVFDASGKQVYPDPKDSAAFQPYTIRVSITDLNIRTGPGTGYARVRHIPVGTYTIVEQRAGKGSTKGWGRLKSGAGWISLDYVTRL